jgi:hypothetical protein
MDAENLKTPEQIKETLFQSWLVEFKGKIWLNTDVMPDDVHGAVQMYEHYLTHGRVIDSPEVTKTAEDFKKLTGYEISDFIEYKKAQAQKLKDNK